MKKVLISGLVILMILSSALPALAEKPIKVTVGGNSVDFDVKPRFINDRTMVPLRAIFEALGAEVLWDDETQTVTAIKEDTTIKLTIDNPKMMVNDEIKELNVPACLTEGRTLVPVRAISEAFGLRVDWYDAINTVKIRVPYPLLSEDYDGTKYTYDENGNQVYVKYNNGYWQKTTYGDYDNEIYRESSDGWWCKITYDENGNQIYWENSEGVWEKYEYDEEGEITYNEHSDGSWIMHMRGYDENGNYMDVWSDSDGYAGMTTITRSEFEDGYKITYNYSSDHWNETTYSKDGVKRHYINSDGLEEIYNEKGNVTYCKFSDGSWTETTYDENDNELYWESSNGDWLRYTYNEDGKEIYRETGDGFWVKTLYNEDGTIAYQEYSDGYKVKTTYTDEGIQTYTEYDSDSWMKQNFDKNGNILYIERSDGSYQKYVVIEK